jgi:hypothetical protein
MILQLEDDTIQPFGMLVRLPFIAMSLSTCLDLVFPMQSDGENVSNI